METLSIIALATLGVVILITILQQVRRDEWWIRMADFPHVQITIVTAATWIVLLVTANLAKPLNIALLVLGLITIIYQLIIIYPFTRLAKKQVAHSPKGKKLRNISLLESNVYMYNRDYAKLHDCIRRCNPDVFIGLETDADWIASLKKEHPDFRHVLDIPLDNTYGMILMSKLPFINQKLRYLVQNDVPSFKVELQLGERSTVLLYVLHPAPPSPTENSTSTERDVELIRIAKEVRKIDKPVLVAGDLNDVAWSHTTRMFQRISGLLDPRIGRGLFNTYHADYPLMRWPLDHIFHSEHFTLRKIDRCEKVGSDHFPMLVSLDLADEDGSELNGNPEKPDTADFQEYETKKKKLNEVQ